MASRNVEIVISARDRFTGTANKVIGSLNKMDRSAGRVGKGFAQMGAGVARAGVVIGAAAVTGLGAAAKAYIDFEDAFAGVRKTMDEADLIKAGMSFESLAKSFRTMATEMPIAATEFARIGETAGALGIRATDIEEFTRVVAGLGVATNLTTDRAAEDLGKIGTILGLTGKGYREFADALVNLGNKGASTETEIIEITKRFAAAGKQAGLSKEQILAYASAIASMGVEPEAAGSSLSRIFNNLAKETALASDKGKAFAKAINLSFKDFEKLVATDPNTAIQKLLGTLSKLQKEGKRLEASRILKGIGVNNVRDLNAILLFSQGLKTLDQAFIDAQTGSGALSVELVKRFDTIASKIQLLKNNLIEAGFTLGEGFAPAIGRAAEKLSAFLKIDANKSRLKELGEDIGKSIDAIDWNAVLTAADQFVGLLKGALSFAKLLYDAFSTLPGPIKEATAGFLVLNKLSGGLIASGAGNVIGGVGEVVARSAGSRLPGAAGRLFAQPVFVTNWPVGGLGGRGGAVGAAGGGLGKFGTALGLLSIVGSAIAVVGTQQEISQQNTEHANALQGTLREWLSQNPTKAELLNGLAGVEQGIRDIESNPLNVLVQGEALNELRSMRDAINRQLVSPAGATGGKSPDERRDVAGGRQTGRVLQAKETGGGAEALNLSEFFASSKAPSAMSMNRHLQKITELYDRTKDPAQLKMLDQAGERIETTLRPIQIAIERAAAAQQAAFAIRDKEPPPKPPVVNVTVNAQVSPAGVVNKYVTIRRYGPTAGSRERSWDKAHH